MHASASWLTCMSWLTPQRHHYSIPPRSDVQVSANKQRRHDITLQQPPQLPNTVGARAPPDNAIAQLLDETGHVTADDREICDGAGRGDAAVEQ